jgi:hypothetical protein
LAGLTVGIATLRHTIERKCSPLKPFRYAIDAERHDLEKKIAMYV